MIEMIHYVSTNKDEIIGVQNVIMGECSDKNILILKKVLGNGKKI